MIMMIGGGTENEGGGSSSAMNNSGGGEGGGLALKKGPWTATEDAILADYVRSHGEGNWNAVQKNTGLARCGKSCRLRWANHLRPNLKKGAFSLEEERIIVELHAKMGNKWARMATQLPGRTDNEIKNHWNTRVKRRQRQGLPLYPPELKPFYLQRHHSQPTTAVPSFQEPPLLSPSSSSFSFQTQTSPSILTSPPLHSLQLSRSVSQPLLHNPYPTATSPPCLHSPGAASTSPPLPSPSTSTQNYASPLPSPYTKLASSILPLFDSSTSIPSLTATAAKNNSTVSDDFFFPRPSPYLQTPFLRFKRLGDGDNNSNNNNNMALNGGGEGSETSSFLSSNSAVFNPQTANYPSFSLDPNTLDFGSPSGALRHHFDSGQFISIPGYVHQSKTELPSNQIFSQYVTSDVTFDTKKENNNNTSKDHHNHRHDQQQQESLCIPIGGTGLLEDMLEDAQILAGFSSSNEGGLASEQMLNVFPSTMVAPEWYSDSGEGSNGGQSSAITEDNLGHEMQHVVDNSLLPAVDNANDELHGRIHISRSWKNLHGIC